MTETTALVTLNHPFHTARGSIGKPLAGREVQVADDGEILVRGDSIAASEWRDGRAQVREAADGWLRTGDIAARNDTGDLVFAGRKGDIIVTAAGLNIHPQDLEAALLRQSGVRGACVFGYDAGAGPQPAAALLTGTEEAQSAVALANESLADYQQIRRWLLWPDAEFPRTSTGKIKRREVAARAEVAFRSGDQPAAGEDSLLQVLRALPGTRTEHATDASRLSEDIGLDSLGMVELQSTLEQRFAVEIAEDAWQRVRTLGDLRWLVAPAPNDAVAVAHNDVPSRGRPGSVHSEASVYPRWPWHAPARWVRIAFLEGVSNPLTHLLLAPRVQHQYTTVPAQPMLIVANHVTAFDLPLVLAALPPRLRRRTAVAMAGGMLTGWRRGRAERHPWFRLAAPLAYWLVTALFNAFPLPQGAGFRRSFAHAGEALDRGMSIMIFPEGRRSTDGTLGSFQSGIGLLARESGVAVLPVALSGLGELKQRQRRWFRPGTVSIRVGEAIRMGADESPQEFTARLEARVRELLSTA